MLTAIATEVPTGSKEHFHGETVEAVTAEVVDFSDTFGVRVDFHIVAEDDTLVAEDLTAVAGVLDA